MDLQTALRVSVDEPPWGQASLSFKVPCTLMERTISQTTIKTQNLNTKKIEPVNIDASNEISTSAATDPNDFPPNLENEYCIQGITWWTSN